MLRPPLPPTPSWFPGHMSHFMRILPVLLTRTDIVIELRDARLPLTSVNPIFESAIQKWRHERRKKAGAGTAASAHGTAAVCERIVVLGKKDLVGQWGIQPFTKAMHKYYPDQRLCFTSHTQHRTVKDLSNTLVSMALQHAAAPEVNVLVVGMPNVGKSTLLNALRTLGVPGPTPKALRTSSHPGLTRALSTRLKLSLDPLIYAFDSPGVMMPFLGRGNRGAERGVKLALIAGIKEGMYDVEALAAYLVYRLWVLNPTSPVYMSLLPPATPQPTDVYEFLDKLSVRLGMLQRGGDRDLRRAAVWFVKWWREDGGTIGNNKKASSSAQHSQTEDGSSAQSPPAASDTLGSPAASVALGLGSGRRAGWGFDFEWDAATMPECQDENRTAWLMENSDVIQRHMEERIEAHILELEEEKKMGEHLSSTQTKKRALEEKLARRRARRAKS